MNENYKQEDLIIKILSSSDLLGIKNYKRILIFKDLSLGSLDFNFKRLRERWFNKIEGKDREEIMNHLRYFIPEYLYELKYCIIINEVKDPIFVSECMLLSYTAIKKGYIYDEVDRNSYINFLSICIRVFRTYKKRCGDNKLKEAEERLLSQIDLEHSKLYKQIKMEKELKNEY